MTAQDRKKTGTVTAERKNLNLSLFQIMVAAREADERENTLYRQGRAQLHVSTAGHEAMAGVSPLILQGDAVYCYYRDRALLLGMGVPLYDLALDFFAKAESGSAGRQMANHHSYKPLNVISSASPTGLQCLPATGTAWGFRKSGKNNVVFCSMGEACTRQGEFFEAVAFARQENLPIIFIVEDNGYGISTRTENLIPLNLGMLPEDMVHVVDGRDPLLVHETAAACVAAARAPACRPTILWIKLDRLMSHTSSDDHAKYRPAEELALIRERDPVALFRQKVLKRGDLSPNALSHMESGIKTHVREVYSGAEQAENPSADDLRAHVFSPVTPPIKRSPVPEGESKDWRMSAAVNATLDLLMSENEKVLLFGEDIEDPKGGVFGLTKSLSTRYPGRVVNSPLAEATIAGIASGLSLTGYMPVFELQFIDFMGPAFNQIVNQIATLRWRSAGNYQCPLILYALSGGYVANGGPWHSQSNESWFAHAPGLKVYMPADANDAAHMFYHAAHGQDPVLILLPKYQLQAAVPRDQTLRLYPEKAQIRREGTHLTVVAWGNCVMLAMEAAHAMEKEGVDIEVLSLCSLVPCDWASIHQSVRKTGRLLVVQEDNRSCSFGQAVISEIMTDPETWQCLYTAPRLVTREDVHIGFSRNLESAALPDLKRVLESINLILGGIS